MADEDSGDVKRQKLPKYMWQEKNTFYVRMAVPKELRAFYSKGIVLRSLHTTDFNVAKTRLAVEVGRLRTEFDKLLNADPFAKVSAVVPRWQTDKKTKKGEVTWEQVETSEFALLSMKIHQENDPKRKAALGRRLISKASPQ